MGMRASVIWIVLLLLWSPFHPAQDILNRRFEPVWLSPCMALCECDASVSMLLHASLWPTPQQEVCSCLRPPLLQALLAGCGPV